MLWCAMIPRRDSGSALLTAVCQYSGLPGAETHTLTHRGRSRAGMGCKQEPLICIKPHFYLLRADTTNTPPPFTWFIFMFQCMRMHTHSNLHIAFKPHQYHHTHFQVSSHLTLSTVSNQQPQEAALTRSKAQRRRPLAGKRSADHWAQLLEDHSRCNPVLHHHTGQVLLR